MSCAVARLLLQTAAAQFPGESARTCRAGSSGESAGGPRARAPAAAPPSTGRLAERRGSLNTGAGAAPFRATRGRPPPRQRTEKAARNISAPRCSAGNVASPGTGAGTDARGRWAGRYHRAPSPAPSPTRHHRRSGEPVTTASGPTGPRATGRVAWPSPQASATRTRPARRHWILGARLCDDVPAAPGARAVRLLAASSAVAGVPGQIDNPPHSPPSRHRGPNGALPQHPADLVRKAFSI